MAAPDPMFAPRLTDAEVIRQCRDALIRMQPYVVPDIVAHAVVARRVTAVSDLDVTDGPIGRFLRTGEISACPARQIWTPLFGRVYTSLPEDLQAQAAVLAVYLRLRRPRGPVDGWPMG